MGNFSRSARLAGLAAIAPACAVLGGLIDERVHLGFTNWRSACRASGISVSSLFHFTLQLLPTAVVGALLGTLLLQLLAFQARRQPDRRDECMAAHFGCAIAMPLGLLVCALAMPVAWMLVVEVAMAGGVAYCVLKWHREGPVTAAPVNP